MRARPFPIVVVAFTALLSWSSAAASPITYLSQTGDMSVSGSHYMIGGSNDQLPISGLSNVDEVLGVSASVPPDGYAASAELTTSLGVTQLALDGFTAASVQNCNSQEVGEGLCGAQAAVDVTVVFDLAVPALTQLQTYQTPSTNNGPLSVLTHTTLGFVLGYDYVGDAAIQACGSLDTGECFALADVFGPGAVLPAGEYELVFDLFAFTPSGSCAVGCNDAGGGVLLSVVPEPGSAALLSAGLVGLGLTRARRGRLARFGYAGRPDPATAG